MDFLDLEQFLDLYNEQALPSKSRFDNFLFDFWIVTSGVKVDGHLQRELM